MDQITMLARSRARRCTSRATTRRGERRRSRNDDSGTYAPKIDPADFSTTIDNPYFPLPVGITYVSMENGDEE
jgi:hypothetical protein